MDPPYDLTRPEIVRVARKTPALTRDFVRKSCCPGPPPESQEEWVGALSRQIESAIGNFLNPEDIKTIEKEEQNSEMNEIVQLHKLTFVALRYLKLLCESNGDQFEYRRQRFYEEMSYNGQATHSEEAVPEFPEVEEGLKYLVGFEYQGVSIPENLGDLYGTEWSLIEEMAARWNQGSIFTNQEAKVEMVPILMAIETHTGGVPEHTGPYEKYVGSKLMSYLEELREEGILTQAQLNEIYDSISGNLK